VKLFSVNNKWRLGLTRSRVFQILVGLVVSIFTAFALVSIAFEANDVGSEKTSTVESGSPLTVFITGANRGLGLEFSTQFHAAGHTVIATARKPQEASDLKALGVRIEELDVTKPESIARLTKTLNSTPIDILINNAGYYPRVNGEKMSQHRLVQFDLVERAIQVNALGPMRVVQALLPNMKLGSGKVIVNISSRSGSLALTTSPGYGYRESKAALNMFTRSIAGELKSQGFTCIALAPGYMRTGMSLHKGGADPKDRAQAIRKIIGDLTIEDTGKFFNYTGEVVPW